MSHAHRPVSLPGDCGRKFRIARKLAAGAFGVVYEAEQLELARRVALKLLHRERLEEPEQARRFVREARVTASIRHPNVVTVYDFGVDEGVPWIAYELLTGGSLRDRLAEGPRSLLEALEAATQIARALEAAHQAGVLHRDIKPDNVLQASPGTCKVADFGIARWGGADTLATQAGMLLGTPAYLAPEYIGGAEPSIATDVYALGMTLFELLTGRLAFETPHPLELLRLQLEAPVPPPSALLPSVPPALDHLVLRALAKSPAARYADASELRRALESVAAGLERGTSAAVSPRPSNHRANARQSTWLAVQARPADGPPAAVSRSAPTRQVRAFAPSKPSRHRWLAVGLTACALVLGAVAHLRTGPRLPAPAPAVTAVPATGSPGPDVRVLYETRRNSFLRLSDEFRRSLDAQGRRVELFGFVDSRLELEDPEVVCRKAAAALEEAAALVRELDARDPGSPLWADLYWFADDVVGEVRRLSEEQRMPSLLEALRDLKQAAEANSGPVLRKCFARLIASRIEFTRNGNQASRSEAARAGEESVGLLEEGEIPGFSGTEQDFVLRATLLWNVVWFVQHPRVPMRPELQDTERVAWLWRRILCLSPRLLTSQPGPGPSAMSLDNGANTLIRTARQVLQAEFMTPADCRAAARVAEAVAARLERTELGSAAKGGLRSGFEDIVTACRRRKMPLRLECRKLGLPLQAVAVAESGAPGSWSEQLERQYAARAIQLERRARVLECICRDLKTDSARSAGSPSRRPELLAMARRPAIEGVEALLEQVRLLERHDRDGKRWAALWLLADRVLESVSQAGNTAREDAVHRPLLGLSAACGASTGTTLRRAFAGLAEGRVAVTLDDGLAAWRHREESCRRALTMLESESTPAFTGCAEDVGLRVTVLAGLCNATAKLASLTRIFGVRESESTRAWQTRLARTGFELAMAYVAEPGKLELLPAGIFAVARNGQKMVEGQRATREEAQAAARSLQLLLEAVPREAVPSDIIAEATADVTAFRKRCRALGAELWLPPQRPRVVTQRAASGRCRSH